MNEPAFPQPDCGHGKPYDSGMTLRDYFAAKALQGLLSDHTLKASWSTFAEDSYGIADAMMKAREA